jgi:glycosyltransferase involved in cell wall biosynthesis
MNIADRKIFKEIIMKSKANNNEFKLVYHGTFAKRYGLDMALNAINIIRKHIPNIHLTLIGAGEYLTKMKEMIKDMNLKKNVDLSSGFVPVAQLPKLLSQADIGLILNREGAFTDGLLPTKLLEYAALGIPVISSRTSCISLYFDDSMLKYFQPGNTDDLVSCILELYKDRTQLQNLSNIIKKINDKYNWRVESEKLLALVEHLSESRLK